MWKAINNWATSSPVTSQKQLHLILHCTHTSVINPLSPNSDHSQISHRNIKGLSVKEVMRIENMITQVQFCQYL